VTIPLREWPVAARKKSAQKSVVNEQKQCKNELLGQDNNNKKP
jgi:hypothetical protein